MRWGSSGPSKSSPFEQACPDRVSCVNGIGCFSCWGLSGRSCRCPTRHTRVLEWSRLEGPARLAWRRESGGSRASQSVHQSAGPLRESLEAPGGQTNPGTVGSDSLGLRQANRLVYSGRCDDTAVIRPRVKEKLSGFDRRAARGEIPPSAVWTELVELGLLPIAADAALDAKGGARIGSRSSRTLQSCESPSRATRPASRSSRAHGTQLMLHHGCAGEAVRQSAPSKPASVFLSISSVP